MPPFEFSRNMKEQRGKLGRNGLIIKFFQYFINYGCEIYTQRINIFILILNYTLMHLLQWEHHIEK